MSSETSSDMGNTGNERLIKILGSKTAGGIIIVPDLSPEEVDEQLANIKQVMFIEIHKVRISKYGHLTPRSKEALAIFGKPRCQSCGGPVRPRGSGADVRNYCHHCHRSMQSTMRRLVKYTLGAEMGANLYSPPVYRDEHLALRNSLCYLATLDRKTASTDLIYNTMCDIYKRSGRLQ